ncbi:DgyrCDS14371 [Dimorphilus gyrociliatus]|uniref:DgyrCDS14371 n=1 Tax=Dimorphilus gyrociliatus TaxID=2664684 RepID=A0A7I8WDE0_9ANNE|nr:DgyrCDS14371 [Dimorphilus gyrociliatus]
MTLLGISSQDEARFISYAVISKTAGMDVPDEKSLSQSLKVPLGVKDAKDTLNTDNVPLNVIGMWMIYPQGCKISTVFEPAFSWNKEKCMYLSAYENMIYYGFKAIKCSKLLFTNVICEYRKGFQGVELVGNLIHNNIINTKNDSKFSFKCEIDEFFINVKYKCDGQNDCFDGSDESNCPVIHYYNCDNDTKRITVGQICDNIRDCKDNFDEKNCLEKEDCNLQINYKCKNNECVSRSSVCDKIRDCMDNSDEENCYQPYYENIFARDYIYCNDGKYHEIEATCDKRYDCEDRSDEDLRHCTS